MINQTPNEVRTNYLKVVAQSVTSGTKVPKGTDISLTVTAIPSPITAFGAVVVDNQNSDGRSVQLFLTDLANNVPQNKGTIALGASSTLALTNGHSFEIVAVDTGLTDCPVADPTNVACQRMIAFATGKTAGPSWTITVDSTFRLASLGFSGFL